MTATIKVDGTTTVQNINIARTINALNIVDNEGTPATVYNGSLASFPSAAIKQTGGSPTWAASDTGTYTFTVTLTGSNLAAMGTTCTAAFNGTHTNT